MIRTVRSFVTCVLLAVVPACSSSVPIGGSDAGDVTVNDANHDDVTTGDGGGCSLPDGGSCARGTSCTISMCPDGTPISCFCSADGTSQCTGSCPRTDAGSCLPLDATCTDDTTCCSGYCRDEPGALRAACAVRPTDGGTDSGTDGGACGDIGFYCTDDSSCCDGLTCLNMDAGGTLKRCYAVASEATATCTVAGQPPCVGGHVCQTGLCSNGLTPISCFCNADGGLGECTGACP